MTRSLSSVMFALSLFVLSIAAVGCGESNTVIEETRSEAEIAAEEEAYEAQMEAAEAEDVTE